MRWLHLLVVLTVLTEGWGCQLPHDWRPQSEPCRAELAEIILYAKVLAIYKDTYSVHNYLPWQYDTDLFYSAEVELLCDQAWGSMLEMPAGSRFNLTGLGYFPCHSYTVVENNTYYFFVRLDESYNIVPHGINFQDPIFPDTAENNQMFASLFQFSNCTSGVHHHVYSAEWDLQEDNRMWNPGIYCAKNTIFREENCGTSLYSEYNTNAEIYHQQDKDWSKEVLQIFQLLCSTVQKALYEEEDRVRKLSQKVRSLEKANSHLREKVKRIKRSLRQVKKESKREAMLMKQLLQKQQNKERGELSAKQDTGKPNLKKSVKKPVSHKL